MLGTLQVGKGAMKLSAPTVCALSEPGNLWKPASRHVKSLLKSLVLVIHSSKKPDQNI